MNALTQAERERHIAAGLITFPLKSSPVKPVKPSQVRPSKLIPPPFSGTPNQRAKHAVKLAKTGIYALSGCAVACGYYPSASIAIREIIAGHGPLTDLCRNALETGRVNAPGSVNTASLRIIRDFYGLPNINGVTVGAEELRAFLRKHRSRLKELAYHAGLHHETLRSFLSCRHGMKQVTIRRVWEAVEELGIETEGNGHE